MYIFRSVLTVFFCLICSLGFSQKSGAVTDSLTGYVDVCIDISALKNTNGVFRLGVGGLPLTLNKENNIISAKHYLKEPRRSFLSFYPTDTINKYPNKQLNEIASRYEDGFEFLAMPGKLNIAAGDLLLNSQIVNPNQAQIDYSDLIQKQWKSITEFGEKNWSFVLQIRSEQNKQIKDSLQNILNEKGIIDQQIFYNNVVFNYTKKNPDSPAPLVFLTEYPFADNVDIKSIASLYNNLSDRIKNLPTAKQFRDKIDSHSFQKSLLGKSAPNFTLMDASGRYVSINNFKGKVTLLEFWASWCGPCLASIPGLVKNYHKYKARGFNIIGVSLDFEKGDWLKAIAKYNLVWPQVSELKGFKGRVSAQYHVFGIPENFLINEGGKVIATNLTEKQLDLYLSRLYQQSKSFSYNKINHHD